MHAAEITRYDSDSILCWRSSQFEPQLPIHQGNFVSMTMCVDCKKEMSDAAPACPNCGRPNKKAVAVQRPVGMPLAIGIFFLPIVFSWLTLRKGYSATAKLISFAWLAVWLLFIFAPVGNKAPAPPANSSPRASSAKSDPPVQVNIGQLLSNYKDNEVRADNLYKGKQVQITGIVGNIKKDIMNSLYVTLGTGAQFEIPEVQAFFDDSMNSQLGGLSKGQQLTVVCRVSGLMMNVLVKECVIQQ